MCKIKSHKFAGNKFTLPYSLLSKFKFMHLRLETISLSLTACETPVGYTDGNAKSKSLHLNPSPEIIGAFNLFYLQSSFHNFKVLTTRPLLLLIHSTLSTPIQKLQQLMFFFRPPQVPTALTPPKTPAKCGVNHLKTIKKFLKSNKLPKIKIPK